MCDYLKRMEKTDVPTEEIRLWSGLAHRVVEYTGPFPTPKDVVIMLWLHEESAVRLLDMCDNIDKKFSELEIENADLHEVLRYADDKNIHLRDALYKEHIRTKKLKAENAKLREWYGDVVRQIKLADYFDCFSGKCEKWKECNGECVFEQHACELGIEV